MPGAHSGNGALSYLLCYCSCSEPSCSLVLLNQMLRYVPASHGRDDRFSMLLIYLSRLSAVRSSALAHFIMTTSHGSYSHLLPPSWTAVITSWLGALSIHQKPKSAALTGTSAAEDTPSFDYGGFVVGEQEEEAVLLAKKAVSVFQRPVSSKLNWNSRGCWLVFLSSMKSSSS